MKITRVELYRRIWSEPVMTVAKAYGLSGVGFAKLCRRHDIPRPPRGYWARRAAGQNIPVPPLPHPETTVEIEIAPYKTPTPYSAILTEAETAVAHAVTEHPIVVPETLRGAHSLVAQSLHALELAKPDENGLLHPPATGCLDVIASKDSLRRALRILDALIKAFEVHGYHVAVHDGKDRSSTVVGLMDTSVDFGIRETLVERKEEVEDDGNVEGRYVFRHSRIRSRTLPSGDLYLAIDPHRGYYSAGDGRRRKWSDGHRGRLEDLLPHFVAGVITVATAQREARMAAERRDVVRREEERRRAEQEAARAAMWEKIKRERARVDRLTADASAWSESQQLRIYIEAVHADAVARGRDVADGSELGQWLMWAKQQADRLDPLVESPPSLLDDEEKYRPPERPRYW